MSTTRSRRKLKDLIRERMRKTGESFVVARFNLLKGEGSLCPACSGMLKREVVKTFVEPDDDATEGQIADYMMAVEAGRDDALAEHWTEEVDVVWCPKCETPTDRLWRKLGIVPDSHAARRLK